MELWKQILMKFEAKYNFQSRMWRRGIWKYSPGNGHFVFQHILCPCHHLKVQSTIPSRPCTHGWHCNDRWMKSASLSKYKVVHRKDFWPEWQMLVLTSWRPPEPVLAVGWQMRQHESNTLPHVTNTQDPGKHQKISIKVSWSKGLSILEAGTKCVTFSKILYKYICDRKCA